MKCIAAIEVDFDESPVGTRSRAGEDLHGRPILTRTVEQVAQIGRVAEIFVLCNPRQSDRCARYIPDELKSRVRIRAARVPNAPFRNLVRTARKWSLDGWRGGVGGVCSMDEYTRTDELALLACEQSADALFCASASAPLLDPRLADEMIDHAGRTANESRVTFAQAPPGLVGTVYETSFLIEMGRRRVPPGMVLSYKPDAPSMDLAHKTCCYVASSWVRHAVGRLIADTDRAVVAVGDYLAGGGPVEAEHIARWLIERADRNPGPLPREIEIELTTEDQLEGTILRPRGGKTRRRGPMDPALIEKIAVEAATLDDSLILLGGFGEPLLHPQFAQILRAMRRAGVYGLAVRTNGLGLTDEIIDALIEHQVDVVTVTLDAWTSEQYRRVHGRDGLNDVIACVRRLVERRNAGESVCPLVVPEMVKSLDTIGELDAFFDGWVREAGWACVAGYNRHAGQMADRSVVNMTPPNRFSCRRLNHRTMILADGKMVLCDQDVNGRYAAGNVADSSVSELWRGSVIQHARERHQGGHFDANPLCLKCDEWHRP